VASIDDREPRCSCFHAWGLVTEPVLVLLDGRRAWIQLAPEVVQDGVDSPIALVRHSRSKVDYSLHAIACTGLKASHHVGARRPGDETHWLM
jgi:hypothetical protein